MKFRRLQCEIQRLKIQTMNEISKNTVSPSVTFFETGTHVKRAGSVLYVHKCAKTVATKGNLPYSTEEVPALVEGQNFSSIRYMDAITKILYHNYTVAACNPLYPKVVKLEDGGFQQYGEALKKFNRVCRNIWQNKNFAIPGFGDGIFKVNRSVTEELLQQTSETIYIEEHSQSLMTKNGCKGAMYAEPVDWTSPAGQKLIRNVVINAKIYIGTIRGKLLQRNLRMLQRNLRNLRNFKLNFKDPLGFSKTVFIKTTYFEDDLENYFLKIK